MEDKFSIRKYFNKKLSSNDATLPPNSNLLSNFADKITTPENALSCIKSGDRVFVGTGCATPRILTKSLENLEKDLEDVQIYHFLVNGAIPFKDGIPITRFYHKSFFIDRVLENMKTTDKKRANDIGIDSEEILDYSIEITDGRITSLNIKNFGGERRLQEISSSLRWTFDKMYEKLRQG